MNVSLNYTNPIKRRICNNAKESIFLLMKDDDDPQNIVYSISTNFNSMVKLIRIEASIVLGGKYSDKDIVHLEIFKNTLDKQTQDQIYKNYELVPTKTNSQASYNCVGKSFVEYAFFGQVQINSKYSYTFRLRLETDRSKITSNQENQPLLGIKSLVIHQDLLQDYRFIEQSKDCTQECQTDKNEYQFNKDLGICDLKNKCKTGEFYDYQSKDCKSECKATESKNKVFSFIYLSKQYCALQSNLCDQDAIKGCEICDLASTNCFQCMKNYEKTLDNKCRQQLAQQSQQCDQYQFLKQGKCLKCQDYLEGCQSCKNENTCIECQGGYFLNKENGVGGITNCIQCIEGCNKCDKLNMCEECLKTHDKIESICFPKCQGNQFRGENNICIDCLPNCQKCSNLNSCDECQQNMLLQEGQCVPDCKIGFYQDQLSCSPCSEGCLKCKSSYICEECSLQMYDLINGICLKKCKSNQYRAANNNCLNCQNNCQSCTRPDKCNTCDLNYYLTENQVCLNSCGSNQFKNEVTRKCQFCMQNCEECTSDIDCSKCMNGYIFIKGGCYIQCLKGQFRNSTNPSICEDCSSHIPNCMSCKGSIECLQCKYGFGLEHGQCVTKCQKGYYIDNKVCITCIEGCAECDDNLSCRICNVGFEKSQKVCVKICPQEGQYYSGGICKNCMDGCMSCSEEQICQKCINNYELIEGKCFIKCNSNQFRLNSNQCQPCSNNCESCKDEFNCLNCSSKFNLVQGYCQQQCTEGQYQDKLICKQCLVGCISCTRIDKCDKCDNGYDLINDHCYLQCPIATFRDSKNLKECLNCGQNCLECTSLNNCNSCDDNFILLDKKSCVDVCPDGKFSQNKVCIDCIDGCIKCRAKNSCTKCNESNYQLQNSSCIPLPNCNSNQFRLSNGSCSDCSLNCQQCRAINQCQKCLPEFVLQDSACEKQCANGFFNKNGICTKCTDNCLLKCKSNQYLDQINNICQNCPPGCLTCQDQTKCTSCDINTFELIQNICMIKCKNYQFRDKQNLSCINCKNGCSSCLDQYNCTSCESSYKLKDNQCIPVCNSDQYLDDISNICRNCPLGCSSCINNFSCKSCQNKLVLISNKCLPECQSDEYRNTIDQQCYKCSLGCQSCIDENKCNSCNIQSHDQIRDRCFIKCKKGQYRDQNYNCIDCGQGCLQCINKSICQRCDEQNDYYFDDIIKVCVKFVEICGDGIIQFNSQKNFGEECDDHNLIDDDGCSSSCRVEEGYTCNFDVILQQSICSKTENNKVLLQSKHDKDSANPNKSIVIYFQQPLQQRDLNEQVLKHAIVVEIQELIEGIDFTFSFEIISETKIQLRFILKKSVKNKQIKVSIISDEFSSRNNIKGDQKERTYDERFPTYVQISEEQKEQTQTVKQVGKVVTSSIMSSIIPIILFSNFSLLFNTLDLFQMIFYLKYVNVRHPYNIIAFLDIFESFQLPWIPNIYDSIAKSNLGVDKNGVSLHKFTPQKFQESEVDSIFLQNVGQDFTQYLILLAVYFFLKIISNRYINRWQSLRYYIQNKVYTGWEWGWHLDCLWEMYLCLVVSSFLTYYELAQHTLQDGFSIINYFFAICFTIVVTALPIIFFFILKRNQYYMHDEWFINRWGMLFEGLEISFDPSNNLLTQKNPTQKCNKNKNFLKIITKNSKITPINKNNDSKNPSQQKIQSDNQFKQKSNLLQDNNECLNNTRQILKEIENPTLSKLDRNYFQIKKNDKFKYLSKYYFVLLYARKWFFALFIVFLHDYPLIQLLLLDLLNICMFFFIIIIKPFKNQLENIKSALCEAFIFSALTALKILVPDEDSQDEIKRIQIGWSFVVSCILILFLQLSFILYQFFKPICKNLKQRCLKRNQVQNEIQQEDQQNNDNLSIFSKTSILFNKRGNMKSKTQKTQSNPQFSSSHIDYAHQKLDQSNNKIKEKLKIEVIPIQDLSNRQEQSMFDQSKSFRSIILESKDNIDSLQQNQLESELSANQRQQQDQSIFSTVQFNNTNTQIEPLTFRNK